MPVIVKLEGMKRLSAKIEDGECLRDAWVQCAARYRAFIQERFSEYSHGNGNWAPLAESTIRARTQAPVTRLYRAIRQGLRLTTKQFADRLKAAQRKAAKHWEKYKAGDARFSILIDTGLLFAATSPVFSNKPGQWQENTKNGIEVGFGGPESYPDGGPTIADVAGFHQRGGGHLPQRKIIVPPPEVVRADMVKYLQKAMDKAVRTR